MTCTLAIIGIFSELAFSLVAVFVAIMVTYCVMKKKNKSVLIFIIISNLLLFFCIQCERC